MNKTDKSLLGSIQWYYRESSSWSTQGSQDCWQDPTATVEELLAVLPDTYLPLKEGSRFELQQWQEKKVRPRLTRAVETLIRTYTYSGGEWKREENAPLKNEKPVFQNETISPR